MKRYNLRGSMSARGNCYDNACAESFFHTLKVECIHGEGFINWEITRTAVFNYIECDYIAGDVTVPVVVLSQNSLKTRTSLRAVPILRG
ncbi:Uncharacterised protein [Serratia plymuthica]|nr:Uncharacterised protein [Serratia plymuthica]